MHRFLFLKSAASNFSPHNSHVLSRRVSGFFSHPLLLKQLTSTFRISTKEFADRKFWLFSVRFSGFNSSFANNGRFKRSWLDQLSADNVVFGLIIANVAVLLAWQILDQRFMSRNFMSYMIGLYFLGRSVVVHFKISNRKINQLATVYCIFLWVFIGFGALGYALSTSSSQGLIGRTLGPKYLLKLYVAGAIGGSVFFMVHHAYLAVSAKGNGMRAKDPSKTASLRASGALNAIVLLSIFLNPRATIYLDFIIPVPAALLGIFLIGKDVLTTMLEKDSRISGSAHLGGAAVAAIAYARIRKGRF